MNDVCSACGVPINEHPDVPECLPDVVRQKERHIRALEQETFEQGARIAELEAWKRDASRVLREWDAVGDAIIERFGVEPPLGHSIAEWCLRVVKGAPSL